MKAKRISFLLDENRPAILFILSIFFSHLFLSAEVFLQGTFLAGYAKYGCLLIWLCLLLPYFLRHPEQLARTVLGELIFLSIYALNLAVFPEVLPYYKEYAMEMLAIAAIYIPAAVVIRRSESLDGLLYRGRNLLVLTSALMVLSFFAGFIPLHDEMNWGTRISLLGMLMVYLSLKKRLGWAYLLYAHAVLLLSLWGGRQTLIFLYTGYMLVLLLNLKDRRHKGILLLLNMLLIISVVLFQREIFGRLGDLLDRLNIESRAVASLRENSIFSFKNRMQGYAAAFQGIRENGIQFNGLLADRLILRQTNPKIVYTHNLFLEILLDFGLLAGPIVLFSSGFWITRRLILNQENRAFLSLFGLYIFVRLFVSSSFLIDTTLVLYFGMLLCGTRWRYWWIEKKPAELLGKLINARRQNVTKRMKKEKECP